MVTSAVLAGVAANAALRRSGRGGRRSGVR
ncbi:hypothetical protein M271_20165 [Streptomyces rapamycinicus NRRL 5491]|nr:hypothetical protein M271_20165 [Streptomyces rapamycinicus NRRL 5491]